jgi:hypothetical protein
MVLQNSSMSARSPPLLAGELRQRPGQPAGSGHLPFAKLLLEYGLQQPDGVETDLGTSIGKLRQNPGGLG